MFIELVDSLRCLGAHEDTWLVAAVARMDGRHIIEGTLGCPLCRREYPIRDGVAWFIEPGRETPGLTRSSHAPDDRVMRAAALLGLTDSGGIVALGGSWADCADGLAELGPAHVVLLNRTPTDTADQSVSSLAVGDRLPFAAASVRAVALDDDLAGTLDSAARVLRSRGRLVAPAPAAVPDGVTELARDTQDWVAERVAVPSAPVALRSARR
jgi:uncharacterized protein YbaR (Trm112 family)